MENIEETLPLFCMLVLASTSPRRHELLKAARIAHVVRPSALVERVLPNESAIDLVCRLAREKAAAVELSSDETALGADTVISWNNQIFLKPVDADDAERMIRCLSGSTHEVITGICLISKTSTVVRYSVTKVKFDTIEDSEIRSYVESGEGIDKAGAYAIQGWASRWVNEIQGCYQNIVGLPVSLVYGLLKKL